MKTNTNTTNTTTNNNITATRVFLRGNLFSALRGSVEVVMLPIGGATEPDYGHFQYVGVADVVEEAASVMSECELRYEFGGPNAWVRATRIDCDGAQLAEWILPLRQITREEQGL